MIIEVDPIGETTIPYFLDSVQFIGTPRRQQRIVALSCGKADTYRRSEFDWSTLIPGMKKTNDRLLTCKQPLQKHRG